MAIVLLVLWYYNYPYYQLPLSLPPYVCLSCLDHSNG